MEILVSILIDVVLISMALSVYVWYYRSVIFGEERHVRV